MLAPAFWTAPGSQESPPSRSPGSVFPTGTVALQIPIALCGLPVATRGLVRRAHESGYSVHVFTSGDDEETPAAYRKLIGFCVDKIMTSFPTRLERFLKQERVAGPGRRDDIDPCPSGSP